MGGLNKGLVSDRGEKLTAVYVELMGGARRGTEEGGGDSFFELAAGGKFAYMDGGL